MGNNYLSGELYNEDFKNRFLKEYEDKTQAFYRYVFQKAFETEKTSNKDIYEMNITELDQLLKSYNNNSVSSVQGVKSVLQKYLNFAIQQGYVDSKINYLQGISGRKDLIKYVNFNIINKEYITLEELKSIANQCVNAQDAICLALPFYGIRGENNSEIINLREKDVLKIENKIYIDGRNEWIQVDDFLMGIIIDALNEEEYAKNNGEESEARVKSCKIAKTPFVVRIGNRQELGAVNPVNIIARINRIRKHIDNPCLTINSIWHSGMFHIADTIIQEKGKIVKDDWINISKRFGKSNWNDIKLRFEDYKGKCD